MLAPADTETVDPGCIFWGSLGIITVTIIGLMGCIPTRSANTENKSDSPSQENGESTSNGRRCGASRAIGAWLRNVYNVTCFTNPAWPCWKTILIKAVVMFITTLASALASLAITRVFAEDDEKFEETVARVLDYVLGETGTRRRRDTRITDGTATATDEVATVLTAAVICTAWTIATITMVVTYIFREKEDVENPEVEEQTGGADEAMGACGTSKEDSEMRLNEYCTDGLEITITDNDAGVDNEQRNNEDWLSALVTMVIEQIMKAVYYMTKTVMG